MKRVVLLFSLTTLCISAFAQQQSPQSRGYTKEEAPTGYEESERFQGRNSSVTMPGKDAPVKESREGNKIKLDFDSKDQPGREQNTSIIRERKTAR